MFGRKIEHVRVSLVGEELKFLFRQSFPRKWNRILRGTLIDARLTTVYYKNARGDRDEDEAHHYATFGFAQHIRDSHVRYFNAEAPQGAIDHAYVLRGGVVEYDWRAFNPRYILRAEV